MSEIQFELVEQFIVNHFENAPTDKNQTVLNISSGNDPEINIIKVDTDIYHAFIVDYVGGSDSTEILTSKESIIEFIKKIDSKSKVWYESGELMEPTILWEDLDYDHTFDVGKFRD